MSLTSGTRLGSYEVISLIGTGGMGEVYKARDLKLGRDVAVKVLRQELSSDPERLRRFEQEARAASGLNHPNIVHIYDIGKEGTRPYIAMELVEGKTLREILTNEPMPIGEILRISSQIASALAKAHSAGIAHRDLKPENIMVTDDGFVKILDFGLAKLFIPVGEAGSELTTLAREGTRPGVVMGTVGYMSPEQASGGTIDFRCDQFAAGAILYEMVTGKRAFQRATAAETLTAIIREETEPIADTKVPPPVRWIIERCLSKKPEERYASTQDLAHELQNVRDRLGEVSSGPSPLAPAGARFKRLGISAVSIIAILALGTAAYLFYQGQEQSQAPPLGSQKVAVAVFENRTGDPALDPIGQMAADWISQGLVQTGSVTVIPSTTVFSSLKFLEEDLGALRGEDMVQALAREIRAGTILSGSYYKIEENLQFQAQVTDVAENRVLVALDPVSGPADEPLDTIEALRQRVMGALAAQFETVSYRASLRSRTPPSYEVYELYIRETDLFFSGDFQGTIDAGNRIMKIDPSYVPALLWAALAHLNLEQYAETEAIMLRLNDSREKLKPYERSWVDMWLPRVRGDRAEAYRVIRETAEDYDVPGLLYQAGANAGAVNRLQESAEFFSRVDRESAFARKWSSYWPEFSATLHLLQDHERELEIAREGRRRFLQSPLMLYCEVRALVALGRIEEVQRLLEEVLTLPQGQGWHAGRVMALTAEELRAHGRRDPVPEILDSAIGWYESRPSEEAESESYRYRFARVLYLAERWDEAEAMFAGLAAEFPDNVDYQGYLGALCPQTGDRDDALRIRESLGRITRPYLFGRHTYWQACISAQLGDRDAAVSFLREALSQGLGYSIELHRDVNLEPLRDYAPFQELMRPK